MEKEEETMNDQGNNTDRLSDDISIRQKQGTWKRFLKLFFKCNLIVSLLQSAVITLVGLALLGNGDIDKRAWVAFFMFSGLFMDSITDLTMVWANVKTIQGISDSLAEIMDAPMEDLSGKPCGRLSGDIQIRDLHFSYSEGKEILHGVNCTLKHNRITALL